MKKRNYFIIAFIVLVFSSFMILKDHTDKLKEKIAYVLENLDKATYIPINQDDWFFDYGFEEGALLNKYEYISSLFSYQDCQKLLDYPIFMSGPHTKESLNARDKYTFGHYNPKFVSELHAVIKELISNKYFVKYTKSKLEQYNILSFLKSYKKVYDITVNYPEEFEAIKKQYLKALKDKTWEEGSYRSVLSHKVQEEEYWNWGETSYHFWLRRDIDKTKKLWIAIVNDVLAAYDYE